MMMKSPILSDDKVFALKVNGVLNSIRRDKYVVRKIVISKSCLSILCKGKSVYESVDVLKKAYNCEVVVDVFDDACVKIYYVPYTTLYGTDKVKVIPLK